MPQDYRRFNGPEDSIPYQRYIKSDIKNYDDLNKELLDDTGKRKDGRALEEARSMCMFFGRTDMVSQAKGSAYIELKKTKVVCSVYDPREIPHQTDFSQMGQIYCEVKFAPFSCQGERRSPVPDVDEKALSVSLRQALEPCVCRHMFPNFQLDIYIYILENDGACLAASINAAGLALANAAVPMYDIITACSLAVIGDKVYIDPTQAEETLASISPDTKVNHGVVTLSCLLEKKQISNFSQVGSMDMECVTNALDMLETECTNILPYIQQVLVSNVVKSADQLNKFKEEEKKREEVLQEKLGKWKKTINAA